MNQEGCINLFGNRILLDKCSKNPAEVTMHIVKEVPISPLTTYYTVTVLP